MRLSQPEIIQILRKRSGMNQGEFGARAFGMQVHTGRTRIKNIELGKQAPTPDDLDKMARVLDVPVSVLAADGENRAPETQSPPALETQPSVLDYFPGLDAYLDLLNKASQLADDELIAHIAAKICELLENRSTLSAIRTH
jgi:transcriptional regulator with XRE-family HTH domain